MGYHVTILRTQQGRNDPLSIDEVKGLEDSFPGAHVEPCSLEGELDLVVSKDESHTYRFIFQNGDLAQISQTPR